MSGDKNSEREYCKICGNWILCTQECWCDIQAREATRLDEIDVGWLIAAHKIQSEKLEVAIEALEKYAQYEIQFKTVGGIFNPKTKAFNNDSFFDSGPMNPAKEALKKIRGEG